MNTSIENKIKTIRELKNYTQSYIADQLGITQAGYNKIEKGKTTLSLTKLEKIAQILDVSTDEILNFDIHKFFKNKNTMNIDNNDMNNIVVKELYENKIKLLEKLLKKTQAELDYYKHRQEQP